MFTINAMSAVPVYEQLVGQVETYVASGILPAGSQLPSVRSLSVSLAINPNTVQKAFSDLIQRGIVTAVPGKGNFVSDNAASAIKEKGVRKLRDFSSLVKELRLYGIEKDELMSIVNNEFDLIRGPQVDSDNLGFSLTEDSQSACVDRGDSLEGGEAK